MPKRSVICAIKDLICKYNSLMEEYEDLKQDLEDNYRPIPLAEMYEINDDFFKI